DTAPPLQYGGTVAYRQNWAEWFPTFKGPVGYEIRELSITVGADLALGHSLNRITGMRTSGESTDVWLRATMGFRKLNGTWLIMHEHFWVPINIKNLEAALDLKP